MKTYNVTLIIPNGKTLSFPVSEDQYILEAALNAGADLPYSCLQGWCLTCAVKILEGTINQDDSRRYYEEDRQEDFGLICTGKPASDLVLMAHQSNQMKSARDKKGLPFPRGNWGY